MTVRRRVTKLEVRELESTQCIPVEVVHKMTNILQTIIGHVEMGAKEQALKDLKKAGELLAKHAERLDQ